MCRLRFWFCSFVIRIFRLDQKRHFQVQVVLKMNFSEVASEVLRQFHDLTL